MKKLLAMITAIVLCLGFASCGKDADAKGDLEKVKEKGKLVIGITDFAPMDYQDKNGNWIGFDADMAREFAKSLGVEAEFVPITWANKHLELNSGTIDCAWNGMTLTDDVKKLMSCSDAYCNNQQIVIVPKDKADKYKTEDSVKNLKFAVEKGSAGAEIANEKGFKTQVVEKQADALREVKAGTSDAAIIDSLMAAAMVGEGTGYPELTYTVGLNNEEYGVGFRKGSDLTEKLNEFFKTVKENGKMQTIAETYKVQQALIK